MIVAPCTLPGRGSSLRVITQNDHANLSAKILGLWRADGLPDHPRRQRILLAAREHDNGWREADSAPSRRLADGRLMDFLSVSIEQRLEIWQRGIRRFADRDPEVTLLIVQHALQLHSHHFTDPEWRPDLEAWSNFRSELLTAADYSEEELAADYRWIDLADKLSLALCSAWQTTFVFGRCQCHVGKDLLEIEPFPLAGATTFSVPCRVIANRSFSNAADLATELALARWQDHSLRVSQVS